MGNKTGHPRKIKRTASPRDMPPILPPKQAGRLREAITGWFRSNQRSLPWRNGYDPYRVWAAEIMLQQTQMDTVLPYYERWLNRFPTLDSLACASQEDVLRQWEGLGYYSRARNFHRAAAEVVAEYGGCVPRDPEVLVRLPGVGRYTAGAIASIAFEMPVPAVDGNVARVLSRVLAIEAPWHSPAAERTLWQVAGVLASPGGSREINQGLMELGALVCRGRSPRCSSCPLSRLCKAHRLGQEEAYPRRRPRPARRVVLGVMVVLQREACYCLRRRPASGLWGGLWEFPWVERERGESADKARRRLLNRLGQDSPGRARSRFDLIHGLTHMELRLDGFVYRAPSPELPPQPEDTAEMAWVAEAALADTPMARMNRKALAQVLG